MNRISDIVTPEELFDWAKKLSTLSAGRSIAQHIPYEKSLETKIADAKFPSALRTKLDLSKWDQGIIQKYKNYPFDNPCSLWVEGPTGAGKSKFCYEIMIKLADDYDLLYIHDSRMAALFASQHDNQTKVAWIEKLKDTRIVMIDDFGHAKYEYGGYTILHDVLEDRLSNYAFRQTFFTVNPEMKKNELMTQQFFLERVRKACRNGEYLMSFKNDGKNLRRVK